jgi:hypothetical protein
VVFRISDRIDCGFQRKVRFDFVDQRTQTFGEQIGLRVLIADAVVERALFLAGPAERDVAALGDRHRSGADRVVGRRGDRHGRSRVLRSLRRGDLERNGLADRSAFDAGIPTNGRDEPDKLAADDVEARIQLTDYAGQRIGAISIHMDDDRRTTRHENSGHAGVEQKRLTHGCVPLVRLEFGELSGSSTVRSSNLRPCGYVRSVFSGVSSSGSVVCRFFV